jgi:hypothetical protein
MEPKGPPVRLPNPFRLRCKHRDSKTITPEQKLWLVHEVVHHGAEAAALARKNGLQPGTLRQWVKKFNDGVFLHSTGGRPGVIDKEEQKVLVDLHDTHGGTKRFQVRIEDSVDSFQDAADKTAIKRGYTIGTIDRTTKYRWEKRLKVGDSIAETTTNARAEACEDLMNFVTFAAMNFLFVEIYKVAPQLILNIDATQFQVGDNKNGRVRVKHIGPITGPVKAKPKKGDNTTGLSFFIKYYLLMSAAGDAMEPVFVVADASMKEGDFHAYKIKGLGCGTDMGSHGHLVFCKTRGCNVAFYKWLNDEFIVPSVFKIRSTYELPDDAMAWFQQDGEPMQIKCYEAEAMQTHMSESNIAVGKPPAATTEFTQGCDNGCVFKGPKTRVKRISDDNVEIDLKMKPHLVTSINDAIADHVSRTRTSTTTVTTTVGSTTTTTTTTTTPKSLSSAHKRSILYGLLRIQKAIAASHTRDGVAQGFVNCGIWPFNLDTICNNCHNPPSLEVRVIIWQHLYKLARIMEAQGELLGNDLEALGIPVDDVTGAYATHAARDDLVVCRRRSVILTNAAVIQREKDKTEAKLQAARAKEAVKLAKVDRAKEKKTRGGGKETNGRRGCIK